MKVLKKFRWVLLGFAILILIVIIWVGKQFLSSSEGPLYGNRLQGVEKVPISSALKTTITTLIDSKSGVKSSSVSVQGLIINVVILVDDTMTIDVAKATSIEVLTKFSDAEKAFYDISFLISYAQKSTKADFPLIGYKNKNNPEIVW